MIKVLALIGSRAGREGNTARLATLLIDELKKVSCEEISGDILTADTWNIRPCLSCDTCFRTSACVQDKLDDMSEIKEKFLACDLFILGSPVFASNVSGDMKMLIDRLSVWLHLMPLIGKFGVPLCTTSNNNAEAVISYLTDMLEFMGASVPTDVTVYRHNGPMLFSRPDMLLPYLRERAQAIVSAFYAGPTFTAKQEHYFRIQSARYEKQMKFNEAYPQLASFGEAEKWYKQGYNRFQAIQDVIKL